MSGAIGEAGASAMTPTVATVIPDIRTERTDTFMTTRWVSRATSDTPDHTLPRYKVLQLAEMFRCHAIPGVSASTRKTVAPADAERGRNGARGFTAGVYTLRQGCLPTDPPPCGVRKARGHSRPNLQVQSSETLIVLLMVMVSNPFAPGDDRSVRVVVIGLRTLVTLQVEIAPLPTRSICTL